MKKYFAEGICSALLVFIGCWSASLIHDNVGIFGIAAAFGITYIVCFYTLGSISGCHLNPIISFAAYLSKRIELKEFGFYALAQCVGAFAGAFLHFILLLMSPEAVSTLLSGSWLSSFGALSKSETNIWAALIVEIIITFIFVFVFIYNQFGKNKKPFAGVVIGLVYFVMVAFAFNLTGACMNPARCLGTSLIAVLTNGFDYLIQFPIFLISTFIGGMLALLSYRKFFAEDCGELRVAWMNFKK